MGERPEIIRSYFFSENGNVDNHKKCIELKKENDEYKNIIGIIEYETSKLKENEKKLLDELYSTNQKYSHLNDAYKQLSKENSDLQEVNKDIIEMSIYEKNKSIESEKKILQEELSIIKQNFNNLYIAYEKLSIKNVDIKIDGNDGNLMDNSDKINKIKDLEDLNRELENKNKKLREEASYQSTLGDALKFHMNDNHEDNSAHPATNIIHLQDNIEKYVTNLKGSSMVINFEAIQELYEKYNVQVQNLKDKILMKIVLQRYVLEKVLECADDYFKIKEHDDSNHPSNQEKYIVNHTNKLLDFLNSKIYTTNFKQDDNSIVIKGIPTKIRQFAYYALTELGFSEFNQEHPFISRTAQKLNLAMAKYRFIKDENKRKSVEGMAEDLVKDIVRIFKFFLLVQEPKYEVHWFKNNVKLDFKFMKVLYALLWDDGSVDDYAVGICYFPFIGVMDLDGNPSKLITHARVYPQHLTKQDMCKDLSSALSEDLLQFENLQDAD